MSTPIPASASSAGPASGAAGTRQTERRIVSMDQFRGYAVIGMFVVNFLGKLSVTHHGLKHNDTHFSWADSIMPAFIFACGFSFRLSVLKRVPKIGRWRAYSGIVKRSFALILVSLLMYGLNNKFGHWDEMTTGGIATFVAEILKAGLWEVLAIIGVGQLLILPFIELSTKGRLVTAAVFAVGHVMLSASFNYSFVTGQLNWMDEIWGTVGKTAWDGGFFGLISWAIPMLAGTLVYDLMQSTAERHSLRPLLTWGLGLMAVGYLASCLTTLYDVRETNSVEVAQTPLDADTESDRTAKKIAERQERHAASPVLPPWENMKNRPWTSLLAEPPFVAPPSTNERKLNYWMMTKRVSTLSFMLFATGFTCASYALFILACDVGGFSSRLFAMFGENALAAYIIHNQVEHLVWGFVPKDSPAWWASVGLLLFFTITWLCVRHLQKAKIYLRL